MPHLDLITAWDGHGLPNDFFYIFNKDYSQTNTTVRNQRQQRALNALKKYHNHLVIRIWIKNIWFPRQKNLFCNSFSFTPKRKKQTTNRPWFLPLPFSPRWNSTPPDGLDVADAPGGFTKHFAELLMETKHLETQRPRWGLGLDGFWLAVEEVKWFRGFRMATCSYNY